ncbi:hypothetical protein 535AP2_70 [Mannheimia phage vB_MhS_535AP2]|nr:hypothetical protein AVV64_gp58 [Mannheimia phage vB_MhS_535AP2]YP_009213829.1 hypothetical protein AVV62_gp58 [Mannheimia phage vB_MhS_1152AP2]AJA73276.1 hypothetical protein 535AP2_70 [Mannheimia phage vB_MhS_535AP2]AJA73356.1 hypothetical protein 1152AP2_71 [Mannheimia phage vB_MhS_1152AP2]AJA73438.1 hypothetical protein 3927AP1_74 [Mannheimia phage vB_MhS_3927AP1]
MLGAFLFTDFKGVAQLVEQRSPKSLVVGLSPTTLSKCE